MRAAATQRLRTVDEDNPYRSFISVPAVPLRFASLISANRQMKRANPVARAKEH
ncbi:hypothetical protein PSAB6_330030 [Paraburkholderia sabiae]|nr:hypothetical protein PSAB6_330030 [Paraburkholderia sabiae]